MALKFKRHVTCRFEAETRFEKKLAKSIQRHLSSGGGTFIPTNKPKKKF